MATDPDCVFCRILAGDLPAFRLYEDEHSLAFMDINPANPGHALVIAKDHWPNLFEIPEAPLGAVMRTARRLARAQQAVLQPDGLNLVQANGPGAAQSVHHFHVHLLPRRLDDGLALNWGIRPGDKDQIAALAEQLRSELAA